MFSKNFWFIVSANLLMALKKTLKNNKEKAVIEINECNPWQSIPTVSDSGGSTFGSEHTGSITHEHSSDNLHSGTGFTGLPINKITQLSKSFSTSAGKARQYNFDSPAAHSAAFLRKQSHSFKPSVTSAKPRSFTPWNSSCAHIIS